MPITCLSISADDDTLYIQDQADGKFIKVQDLKNYLIELKQTKNFSNDVSHEWLDAQVSLINDILKDLN